ncbi:hypothetical protein DRW03_10605 [Corallococcus sp. H22C18031201]|nr:hypothetical protein DRW03_10605 [Corallococcus sp. H22C18031201]
MSQPRSSRRGRASLAALLVLGLTPAARAQVSVTPGLVVRLQVGDQSTELQLSRDAIQGRDLWLRRTEAGLVGRLHGKRVNVGWGDGPVEGHVGEAPVRLTVQPRSAHPGVTLEGAFAGWETSFGVSPVGISGAVGGCNYSLPHAANRYEGWRTCQASNLGRGPVPVRLELPVGQLALGETETAVLLSLLLSDVTLPPPP